MAANGTNGQANGHELPALATSAEDFLRPKYDYVIVGGGTAGLVVAARLSENPDVTVGVLEAGKNQLDNPLVDIPGAFLGMFSRDEYDYAFMTEPQKGNHDVKHHIVRGKMLGGSSGINYMMYVRGSDQDYDDWAIISGDESWNSKNMKQYMRKHQTLEPIDDSITERSTFPFVGENHGTSGPCRTSFNPWLLPIEGDFIKACDEVTGMNKKPKDPWSGDHIGFYNTLGLVARTGPNKGKRSYAARGYFAANAQRPNLHVLCEATVTSVELTGDTATGVNFIHGGNEHTVKVSREVVVSCGAIQSPQILELSGIGDPEVLKKAGVECKIENKAVGNNFQDHSLSATGWELKAGNMTLDAIHTPEVMADAQKALAETQSGPLTCISSTQGFFPYKLFATEEKQQEIIKSIEDSMASVTPFQQKQYARIIEHLKSDHSANLQIVLIPARAGWDTGVADQSRLFIAPESPESLHQMTGAMCLQYPVSRGSVHIKSSNVNDHPIVDPGYLSHPADVGVLGAGIRMLGKVEKTSHLADKINRRIKPDPEVDISDVKQVEDWVRSWVLSEYHVCGSVAMGDAVDTRLRVKGAKNLRVVDASIFPNNVSGNIVSSVYMVAERGADIIKEDWDYAALSNKA